VEALIITSPHKTNGLRKPGPPDHTSGKPADSIRPRFRGV